ncbi:hypothetical protein [Schwartzia succinivorans]|jgi:hypothetical protein|uniref:Phage Tail Collar Domain n=1 Tax=Schwartzia succinivorans DSM 10502 TaxID=1123243 RepID=A0A1M4V6S6_9FIRM|nr:hypothetical protein [Schwartzia succinivorans]SHE64558.1 hypothetical protein SAMN02745190_00898 [Schwartzia succinivorans DSM 10502]
MIQAGQYITDGTCVWIVDDIRDGDRVGDVVFHSVLLPGHILADGAALADVSTDYPRLLSWARANNMITLDSTDMGKYYYDSEADTLRVPKADDGRFIEGSTTAGTAKNAGLPNIKGDLGRLAQGTNGALPNGAFYTNGVTPVGFYSGNDVRGWTMSYFDASRSNSIYSDSVTTVQPKALTSIAQIKY